MWQSHLNQIITGSVTFHSIQLISNISQHSVDWPRTLQHGIASIKPIVYKPLVSQQCWENRMSKQENGSVTIRWLPRGRQVWYSENLRNPSHTESETCKQGYSPCLQNTREIPREIQNGVSMVPQKGLIWKKKSKISYSEMPHESPCQKIIQFWLVRK